MMIMKMMMMVIGIMTAVRFLLLSSSFCCDHCDDQWMRFLVRARACGCIRKLHQVQRVHCIQCREFSFVYVYIKSVCILRLRLLPVMAAAALNCMRNWFPVNAVDEQNEKLKILLSFSLNSNALIKKIKLNAQQFYTKVIALGVIIATFVKREDFSMGILCWLLSILGSDRWYFCCLYNIYFAFSVFEESRHSSPHTLNHSDRHSHTLSDWQTHTKHKPEQLFCKWHTGKAFPKFVDPLTKF